MGNNGDIENIRGIRDVRDMMGIVSRQSRILVIFGFSRVIHMPYEVGMASLVMPCSFSSGVGRTHFCVSLWKFVESQQNAARNPCTIL